MKGFILHSTDTKSEKKGKKLLNMLGLPRTAPSPRNRRGIILFSFHPNKFPNNPKTIEMGQEENIF